MFGSRESCSSSEGLSAFVVAVRIRRPQTLEFEVPLTDCSSPLVPPGDAVDAGHREGQDEQKGLHIGHGVRER